MQVHARFYYDNMDKIEVVFLLGDDNAAVMNAQPNDKKLRKFIADNFNMKSKNEYNTYGGTFCQMAIYKDALGKPGLGPDFVRLKNKFEVTSGKTTPDDLNLLMRTMSYAMFIGDTPEMQ